MRENCQNKGATILTRITQPSLLLLHSISRTFGCGRRQNSKSKRQIKGADFGSVLSKVFTLVLSGFKFTVVMERESKNMVKESILCVGLVCIDNFFVVEKYPEEDSDQPASEAFKAGFNCL